MTDKREIRISEEVVRAIEAHLADLSAASVEEYVEAVLRERLREEGCLPAYSPEEEREVTKHLRDLGYLD
jgi:hypothetical protein